MCLGIKIKMETSTNKYIRKFSIVLYKIRRGLVFCWEGIWNEFDKSLNPDCCFLLDKLNFCVCPHQIPVHYVIKFLPLLPPKLIVFCNTIPHSDKDTKVYMWANGIRLQICKYHNPSENHDFSRIESPLDLRPVCKFEAAWRRSITPFSK